MDIKARLIAPIAILDMLMHFTDASGPSIKAAIHAYPFETGTVLAATDGHSMAIYQDPTHLHSEGLPCSWIIQQPMVLARASMKGYAKTRMHGFLDLVATEGSATGNLRVTPSKMAEDIRSMPECGPTCHVLGSVNTEFDCAAGIRRVLGPALSDTFYPLQNPINVELFAQIQKGLKAAGQKTSPILIGSGSEDGGGPHIWRLDGSLSDFPGSSLYGLIMPMRRTSADKDYPLANRLRPDWLAEFGQVSRLPAPEIEKPADEAPTRRRAA